MGEVVQFKKFAQEEIPESDPIDLDSIKEAILRLATRGNNGEDISSPLREFTAKNIISVIEIISKSRQNQ
jgi:hypothetical protein